MELQDWRKSRHSDQFKEILFNKRVVTYCFPNVVYIMYATLVKFLKMITIVIMAS